MIGGFSQGAALALYVASKLTPDESIESCDEPVMKKNKCKSKRGSNVKSEYQSQYEAPKERHGFDNKTNEMQVDDQLNAKSDLKKKIKNEGDNIEETKKRNNNNLGAVIFCSGFLLFKNPSTEIFKINQFPIFVYHGEYDDMINCEDTVEPFRKYFDDDDNVTVFTEEIGHTMDKKEWKRIKDFMKHINDKNNV